jgi:ribonuclease G
MNKEILIYHRLNDIQIAVTTDGSLSEIYFENPEKEKSLGNIYLGRVTKILTGINAAFVDIGTDQDAFLHFSDIDETLETKHLQKQNQIKNESKNKNKNRKPSEEDISNDEEPILDETDTEDNIENEISNEALRIQGKATIIKSEASFHTKSSGEISLNLSEGQFILVQIIREAYSNKGVRVTTKIGIPGRYIVLFPFSKNIGISKKIINSKERVRLKKIARSHFPKDFGFIIRTESENKSDDDITNDCNEIISIWNEIKQKISNATSPKVVYQDMELAKSVVRDHFNSSIKRLITNSNKLYKEITHYLSKNSKKLAEKVELYQGNLPIFEFFGIQKEIDRIYQSRVSLKNGGYVIFDRTEAMTVVDVNSGRTKEKEQENLSFMTNSEAAREISKQIRLRDIGGIILIDFIDMQNDAHRRRIFYEMKREMALDRAKVVVFPLTQLCLMQITRQRINQNAEEKTMDLCPICEGTGRVQSKFITFNTIENWIKKFVISNQENRLILFINPSLAEYITSGDDITNLNKLMIKYGIKISLRITTKLTTNKFKFYSIRQQKDITADYL